jgi:hypothetical protein
LIGGDHHNPFTATIHLYSDVPAITLHEGGYAKDFARRTLPGTYALVAVIPFGNLRPEAIATGDALAYSARQDDADLEREGYRILFPAYGTYFGGSVGDVAAPLALPIYAGAVVAGHAVGRVQARVVPDTDGGSADRGCLLLKVRRQSGNCGGVHPPGRRGRRGAASCRSHGSVLGAVQ